MGIVYCTASMPDLHHYEPEFNADGTEKHIVLDGARFHVLSYSFGVSGCKMRCSEKRCEINKEPSP